MIIMTMIIIIVISITRSSSRALAASHSLQTWPARVTLRSAVAREARRTEHVFKGYKFGCERLLSGGRTLLLHRKLLLTEHVFEGCKFGRERQLRGGRRRGMLTVFFFWNRSAGKVVRYGNVDRACIPLWLEDRKGHLVLEVQLMLVLIDFLDKFVVGLEVALQGCYHLIRI
jgi:hypothetical protein